MTQLLIAIGSLCITLPAIAREVRILRAMDAAGVPSLLAEVNE